ncbi:SIS domain-containing protein, partial [Comamonas thiooxydans]
MLEQRIQQHFIDSADLKYQAAQALSQPIASAVQAMLACVTGGGKVLACGTGVSASDAQLFASLCVTGFERDRPELAAVALTSDGGLLGSVGATGSGGNASQYLA